MRKCTICGKNIDHLHGNAKQCNSHKYVVTGVERKQVVTVGLDYFMELLADSDKLKGVKRD